MAEPFTILELTRTDLIGIALATQSAADAASLDDRLQTAADQYTLAARLWRAAGYHELATQDISKANHARSEWVNAQVSELEEEDA
jgi:hypothetical protein